MKNGSVLLFILFSLLFVGCGKSSGTSVNSRYRPNQATNNLNRQQLDERMEDMIDQLIGTNPNNSSPSRNNSVGGNLYDGNTGGTANGGNDNNSGNGSNGGTAVAQKISLDHHISVCRDEYDPKFDLATEVTVLFQLYLDREPDSFFLKKWSRQSACESLLVEIEYLILHHANF